MERYILSKDTTTTKKATVLTNMHTDDVYRPRSPYRYLKEAAKVIEIAKSELENQDPNEMQELTQSISKFTLMDVQEIISQDCYNGKVVESIVEGEKRSKVRLQGRKNIFWVFGKFPEKPAFKKGDVVDIEFETILVNTKMQNWITSIRKSETKKAI